MRFSQWLQISFIFSLSASYSLCGQEWKSEVGLSHLTLTMKIGISFSSHSWEISVWLWFTNIAPSLANPSAKQAESALTWRKSSSHTYLRCLTVLNVIENLTDEDQLVLKSRLNLSILDTMPVPHNPFLRTINNPFV